MDEMRSSAVAPAGALDVSTLPPLGELLEALTAQLAAWMPAQRWYAHKGRALPRSASGAGHRCGWHRIT